MMGDDFVNTGNAQRAGYGSVVEKIAQDKICPFCEDNLPKIHPNPLDVREYWTVTKNAYPYKPTRQHVLLIHRVHVAHLSELSSAAWSELQDILRELSAKLGIEGATLVMRFGDTRFTGASVTHLHAQLVQGDPDDSEYDPARGVICRVG